METVHEEWRPVKSNEDYAVSNFGRVKSLGRIVTRGDGVRLTIRERVLRLGHSRGYQMAVVGKARLVHILVAEAFIGPRPEGLEINHIDGIKHNNHVSNLEYVTASENAKHAIRTGLWTIRRGEKRSGSKFTERQIRHVHSLVSAGASRREAAKASNVSEHIAYRVCAGLAWKHLGLQAIPKGEQT